MYAVRNFTQEGLICRWTLVRYEPAESGIKILSQKKYHTNDTGCGIFSDGGEMILSPEDFPLANYKNKKQHVQTHYRKLGGDFKINQRRKKIRTVVINGIETVKSYKEVCEDLELSPNNKIIFITHGSVGIMRGADPMEAKRVLEICKAKGYRTSRQFQRRVKKTAGDSSG